MNYKTCPALAGFMKNMIEDAIFDHPDNEPNILQNKNEIFSFDSPSSHLNIGYNASTKKVETPFPITDRMTFFEEYVRIAFLNGNQLNGNGTHGSRCSVKVPWSINYSTFVTDSYDPNNKPYEEYYQFASKISPSTVIITKPTNFFNNPGNGTIDIVNINSTSQNYYLNFDIKLDKFHLFKKRPGPNLIWDFVKSSSSQTPFGTWEILNEISSPSPVEIIITQGSIPFQDGSLYFFWVLNSLDNNFINIIDY